MALTSQLSRLCTRIADEFNDRVRSNHPALARAWVSFGVHNNHVSIQSAHNVLKVVRLTEGHFRVRFSEPMPHTHYCWQAMARSPRASTYKRGWFGWLFPVFQPPPILILNVTFKTADTLDLVCTTLKGRFSDSTDIQLVVYA